MGNVIFDVFCEKVVMMIELRVEVVRNYLRFGFFFLEIWLIGVNLFFNMLYLLDFIDCEWVFFGKVYVFDFYFMGYFLVFRLKYWKFCFMVVLVFWNFMERFVIEKVVI